MNRLSVRPSVCKASRASSTAPAPPPSFEGEHAPRLAIPPPPPPSGMRRSPQAIDPVPHPAALKILLAFVQEALDVAHEQPGIKVSARTYLLCAMAARHRIDALCAAPAGVWRSPARARVWVAERRASVMGGAA